MTGHPPIPATTAAAWAGAGAAVRLLTVPLEGRTLRLRLLLESVNTYGSVKDRTANALLASLEAAGDLHAGGRVVESTSGNLGVALAGMCAERGYRCTLVVDDATSPFLMTRMTELGAELIHVTSVDNAHAVAARIQTVRKYLADHPGAAWTDQYGNLASPAVHARTTGPALLHHAALPHPHAVAVPVSTGGTLAGAASYIRRHAPEVQILAVDAEGSAATGGEARPRPRKLPGFGSGMRSAFLSESHTDAVVRISDSDAAEACRILHTRTGIHLGGSAGAATVAAVRTARNAPDLAEIAVLCPDGGDRYQNTIYAPGLLLPTQRQLGNDPDLAAISRAEYHPGSPR